MKKLCLVGTVIAGVSLGAAPAFADGAIAYWGTGSISPAVATQLVKTPLDNDYYWNTSNPDPRFIRYEL